MPNAISESNPTAVITVNEEVTIPLTTILTGSPSWRIFAEEDEPFLHGMGVVGSNYTGTPVEVGNFIMQLGYATGQYFLIYIKVVNADGGSGDPEEEEETQYYCLKRLITDKNNYYLGGGVTGSSIADLSRNLNEYFWKNELPITSEPGDGVVRLTFQEDETLQTAQICDDSEITINTIQAPVTGDENNEFFGKDNPTDTEYSYYTLINTCACGAVEEE